MKDQALTYYKESVKCRLSVAMPILKTKINKQYQTTKMQSSRDTQRRNHLNNKLCIPVNEQCNNSAIQKLSDVRFTLREFQFDSWLLFLFIFDVVRATNAAVR